MIVIIDYDMGNIGSILNMLRKIGASAKISSAAEDIRAADKLILPGVGAFDNGMLNIKELGLLPILNEKVLLAHTPILGICLGMQLLLEESEEGQSTGLSWIKGKVVRFRFEESQADLKVPHMGWNTIQVVRDDPLFKDLQEGSRFYFVHSYHIVCTDETDILSLTHHGYNFISTLRRGNIMGTQFHPEKSHRYGMKLLKNFTEMVHSC